ncbi:MAG: response regulator [Candidatus Sphingomonas colombiensis]|nr:response regulator [Sphingomonas sp.]WEK45064.1 MAG: response regulator [Sphingomonas sp.]
MVFGRKDRRITRLLLVEDEPLVAFEVEHLLTHENYQIVATVDRVALAVTIIREADDIDLVLVDVELADGSGVEVARVAAEHGIPVLFVTGNFPEDAEPLASGHLAKPFAQRDLLAAISAIDATLAGVKPRRLPSGFRLFTQSGASREDRPPFVREGR